MHIYYAYMILFTLSHMQKELRKRISEGTKTITLEQLSSFISSASKSNHKQQPSASSQNGVITDSDQPAGADENSLCPIPKDVPVLPGLC